MTRVAQRRYELGVIVSHARVIVLGQLATMAFGVTDAVVAGRHADASLATLAIASSIFISVYVSLMSVMQALMPIYSELHGARRPVELGSAVRQSAYLACALMGVGMVVMLNASGLLAWFGVPQALRPAAQGYLAVLAWGLIPTLAFRMFATLTQSLGAPKVVMLLQMASLALKIPLTVWFVSGGAGLAPMGVVGCAWASFVVHIVLLSVACLALARLPVYRPLALFHCFERPDWVRLRTYASLGIPAGLASMVEVTSYALMGLLVARMGVVATAAHHIASSVAAALFMFPLSLSIASSARVSYWLGAGQPVLAHGLARHAVWLTVGVAALLAMAVAALARPIAGLYTTSPEVATLGTAVLWWVALYHIADAWQAVGCFLLRCWRITVMPMVVYGLALWGLGLGGGHLLAYEGFLGWPAWQQPAALWCMGSCALAIAALAFQRRIWQLTSLA